MTDYRTESVFFAVALALAIGAAAMTTVFERSDMSDDASYGKATFAQPHDQLDRALGEPLRD
jgi:hypothetical protein